MKHTKKWLQITAGTLALTGAIATPIALTSCSKTSPIQPVETNGQIEVSFIGADLTKNLEPFQNIKIPLDDLFNFKNKETGQTYHANELDFEFDYCSLQSSLKLCFSYVLDFETISENTNTYLATSTTNLSEVVPGTLIDLPIDQISLKSDPTIKADFNGGAYHLNLSIKDDLKEILPTNYEQFAWNLSASLASDTGDFNYTNLPGTQATNGVHSDLSGNMTVQKSYLTNSMYNGDINPNGFFWGDYQVCPSITPSLISTSNPNDLVRTNAENTANNNLLDISNLLYMYLDTKATSSKVLEWLENSFESTIGSDIYGFTSSCLQLLLSNDTSNATYADYYQGNQIVLWVYLQDSSTLQTGIANPTHEHLFQKITVNFA